MLAILGATGFTGRLCAAEAARLGLPLTLAGRRASAVASVAAEIGGAQVRAADVADPASLRELCESVDVVLTCVGPYARFGESVVDACIATGTHYLDICGEVGFLESVHARDREAREAGCALIPGAGFDGVPGEALAVIAAGALTGPPDRVRVGYAVADGAVSAGTVRSALGVAASGGAVWRGKLVREPAFTEAWRAPWPGGEFGAVSVPFPEVVTVGRSTGAHVVRSFLAAPAGDLLATVAGPLDAITRGLSRTPLRALAERAIDRLPAGPSPERRAQARTRVVAEARGLGVSSVAAATVDDLYLATAKGSVALAAALLAADEAPVGALTPVQAALALGHDPHWLLEALGATLVT